MSQVRLAFRLGRYNSTHRPVNMAIRFQTSPPSAAKDSNQKSGENSSEVQESFIDKYLMLAVRVIVGVGLITGVAQNSRLGRANKANTDYCDELESKMERVTDTMCSKEWVSDMNTRLTTGNRDILRASVTELLKSDETEK